MPDIFDEIGKPSRSFGLREDKTQKGLGFLGDINKDGDQAVTELSIGVHFDGKEHLIPSIVPTLSKEEIESLRTGGKMTPQIINKAVKHAKKRISQGKNPFAQEGEQPTESRDIFDEVAPKQRGKIAQTAREVGIGAKGLGTGALSVLGNLQQLTNKLMGVPSPIELPGSQQLKEAATTVTGGKLEPETGREEFIEQTGDLLGSLLTPLGGGGIQPIRSLIAALSGTGGEKTAKALGAPKFVQKTVGFLGTLIPFLKRGKGLPPATKAAQLAEKEAIKVPAAAVAAKLPKRRLKFGKATEKVEKRAFEFEKSVERAKDRILESVTPIAKGEKEAEKLSRAASDLFRSAEAKADLIKGPVPTSNLQKVINKSIVRLEKSPALATEETATLSFLKKLDEGLQTKNTTESLMTFNKSINKEINFLKPTSGDRVLLDVKEALMKDISNVGKKNPGFFRDWKKANASFAEAKKFQKIREVLSPAFTEEGLNFTKFEKLFSDVKKQRQLTSLLGKEQFKRLKDISKLAKKGADVFKSLQKDSKFISQVERMSNRGIIFSVVFGKLKQAGIFAGEKIALGTLRGYYGRLMTDPDYSKHYLNFLKALKQTSKKGIIVTAKKVNEDIEKTKMDLKD